MRVVKILFFFCLIGVVQLKAQTNFVHGYYITPTQDTVRGYLEYRLKTRNFEYCVFKQDLSGASVRLNPGDIKGYVFENKDIYERHAVRNKKGEELDAFFHVLLRSDLSLLQYRSRYFVKNQQGEVVEISRMDEWGDKEIVKDYGGVNVLRATMKDCDQATANILKILKTKPDVEEAFKAIFEKYYQCKGESPFRTETLHIKPHVDFGVLGSAAQMKLQLGGALTDVRLSKVNSFSVGGYASFFLPRINERFRLVVEATYTKYKNYAYFSVDNTNNDLYIDHSTLRVPVLARYSTKVLFLELGIQSQFMIRNDPRWRVETQWSDAIYTTDAVVNVMPDFTFGYVAGAGVKYNVADHPFRTSIRFSNIKARDPDNRAYWETLELMLSVQINRER